MTDKILFYVNSHIFIKKKNRNFKGIKSLKSLKYLKNKIIM